MGLFKKTFDKDMYRICKKMNEGQIPEYKRREYISQISNCFGFCIDLSGNFENVLDNYLQTEFKGKELVEKIDEFQFKRLKISMV